MVNRIRDEGLNRSKVMETAAHLTDRIGPRLTNSPQAREAVEWTRARLAEWGLANAHVEAWGPFGRGWSYEHAGVRIVSPVSAPMAAVPKAWTPGTAGAVRGPALKVKIEKDGDLEALAGKLAGRVLLLSEPREIKDFDKPLVDRFTAQELDELALFGPEPRRGEARPDRETSLRRFRLQKRLRSFLKEEGALATLEASERER